MTKMVRGHALVCPVIEVLPCVARDAARDKTDVEPALRAHGPEGSCEVRTGGMRGL